MNPITYCAAIASLQGLCGATAVNHIVSLAIGGTNDPSSLAPVCRHCNDAKSTAEKRFIARGYDTIDVMRDTDLADWTTSPANIAVV